MKQVYDILGAIERHFKDKEVNTNTVTFGSIDETQLQKTNIFPLAHFNISEIEFNGTTMNITIQVMCLDIIDEDKKYDQSFTNATNFQDVLNTQAFVVNHLVDSFRGSRGYLADKQYVLVNEPIAELLQEKFESNLAGWGVDITIQVPNDISIC